MIEEEKKEKKTIIIELTLWKLWNMHIYKIMLVLSQLNSVTIEHPNIKLGRAQNYYESSRMNMNIFSELFSFKGDSFHSHQN